MCYEKGKKIEGLPLCLKSTVFHAGTKIDGDSVLTNGGRVLAVTSVGEDFEQTLEQSYKTIQDISFEGIYFRKDIGFDL